MVDTADQQLTLPKVVIQLSRRRKVCSQFEIAPAPNLADHKRTMLGPAGADFASSSLPPLVDAGDEGMRTAVAKVERMLAYSFRDPRLLEEALTHSSDTEHPSYQRLEFLGDAALCLAFTNYVYLNNPGAGPGQLTVLRAANISTEKLARVAVRHDLYRLVRRNSPMLDQIVDEFTQSVLRERDEDLGCLHHGGSSVKAPKVLADIVESITAAVYVDCDFNLKTLWRVIRSMLEPIITLETLDEQPVTTLYELCQKRGKSVYFKNWKKGQTNVMNVFVDDKLIGIGSSEQKIIAKLNAARDALEKLLCPEAEYMDMEPSLPRGDEAGEQVEGSKQKLSELCSKNRWPRPVYKILVPRQSSSNIEERAQDYEDGDLMMIPLYE
ncbi:ribonuclease 3-like protein 2 isoform X2 [Elaeis guineensis]|uniref:Ribonuclease 3-like protein 2 isoform X2 n=1 Tax=Elaeis guineensis var. tenera TaxID=51953 RepID=A0A6I9RHF0_ELAGV|nr:ribonuclease 3-like protein 2 isoform X2 [Elaeis guineensis]